MRSSLLKKQSQTRSLVVNRKLNWTGCYKK
jgi:hypothetical protein